MFFEKKKMKIINLKYIKTYYLLLLVQIHFIINKKTTFIL